MGTAAYMTEKTAWDLRVPRPEARAPKRFDAPEANFDEWWSKEADAMCDLVSSYADLEEDWDTYGAVAPNASVIKLTKLAIVTFEIVRIKVREALPDAAGRITLHFCTKGVDLEVSIDETEWGVLIERPGREDEYHTIDGSDPANVHRVVALV